MSCRPLALAAVLSLVFGLLFTVPLTVLGAAIDWPASLDAPAPEVMRLIVANAAAVRLGYSAYMLYSLLFVAVIAALVRLSPARGVLVTLAVALAAASSLARSVGIVRWLTVLPELAEQGADPTVFAAVNSLGGAVGELLGVSAFAAGALVATVVALRQVLPRVLVVAGYVVAGGLLLPWLEVFGVGLDAALTGSVAALQSWFLAVGGVLAWRAVRAGRADAQASPASATASASA